ncbi:uncharacterized protein EV154DRAFT_606811 [Mucor mucedo]|uniref:uncharacterized protein n=1 Tax=Mucor mucedo TaxID=29922 RepID=UPI0022212A22|nr:uncharacterized protein EV154DRAFT_606811 [Mucor mucedo]KAI7875757.1 hypothetical protein EV154DRAFT_606811 [Mucor mucedo]
MTNDKSKAGSTGRFSATRDFDPKQQSFRNFCNRLRAKANSQPTSSDSGTLPPAVEEQVTAEDLNTNTEAAFDRINIEETEHDISLDDHVDSVETEEVEENEVEDFITDILPRGSEKIQARLSTEEYPSEYERGTFWIEPMMSYFIHKNNKKIEDIYQPRVFLWIPHLLIDEKLAGLCCPTCDSKIETKGYNKLPHARRIADLQSCFYLMSIRYRCLSPRCGKTFNGHSDSIISQLPYELQMEFPAVLTHKGGVSKTVGDLLRPCIQNSVGPKRFQKILLELHHIRHNRLELQYLISTFRKRNGVARYFSRSLPCAHNLHIDSGSQMKKTIQGKIEDTSVFTGLYTVTNEYEEIVQQVLAPSKALSYLRYSFQKMREAYSLYGHEMPIVFFTDNVKGDKSFLESIFDSLKEKVQLRSNMEILSTDENQDSLNLPQDVEVVYVVRNLNEIDRHVKDLLECIKNESDKATGFDCKWMPFSSDSKVDVMQIAYKNKVGGDLGRINTEYRMTCRGALELGSFCSSRKCIPSGQMSLAEISFRILGPKILKDERLSEWSTSELSSEQIQYAAIDAWASLEIYNKVKNLSEIDSDIVNINVIRVQVPAFFPGQEIGPTNGPSLDSFGPTPFNLVVLKIDLVTETEAKVLATDTVTSLSNGEIGLESVRQNAGDRVKSEANRVNESTEANEANEAFGALFPEDNLSMVDNDNFIFGYKMFLSIVKNQGDSDSSIIYTRVVKDIFHLMDMIKPYKRHTLYKEFVRRFSGSLFIMDEEDQDIVKKALETNGLSWDNKLKYDRTWILKRVRRKVPSPDKLLPTLMSLFLSFGLLKCSKSARTLSDKLAWKQALSVLKTVELGHASDPPGIQLYYKTVLNRDL